MLTSEYLLTDHFLTLAKEHYDVILIEQEIDNQAFSLEAMVLHHLNQTKSILVILKDTPLENILALTENKPSPVITIINPSLGVLGFANKGFWDKGDITKAFCFGYEVIEPAYQEDILSYLKQPHGKKYLRINEHTALRDDLPKLNYVDANDDVFSLQEYGFSGSHGTIIALGNASVDIIHAGVALQEKGKAMDVFVSKNARIPFAKAIQESIQRTEKLIIVCDQHPGTLYESWIKAQLWETGLIETEVFFVTPDYETITTILMEYIYEQAKFDGNHIAEKISNL